MNLSRILFVIASVVTLGGCQQAPEYELELKRIIETPSLKAATLRADNARLNLESQSAWSERIQDLTDYLDAVSEFHTELAQVCENVVIWSDSVPKESQVEAEIVSDFAASIQTGMETLLPRYRAIRPHLEDLKDNKTIDRAGVVYAMLNEAREVEASFHAELEENFGTVIAELQETQTRTGQLWSIVKGLSYSVSVQHAATGLGLELAVEDGQPVVSLEGAILEVTDSVSLEATVPIAGTPSQRSLYVETAGGARLSYDISDKRVRLSIPILQYRVRYRGFNIVVSVRN